MSQAQKCFFFSGLFHRMAKAVFHRKKVVQLSLNNHWHAILKMNEKLFFRFYYDSCGSVFPPFFIFFPSKWCLRINCEWQEGKYKMLMRPFYFHFPFFFYPSQSWKNKISNYSDFFPSSSSYPARPSCFPDNYSSTKTSKEVISVTFRWPHCKGLRVN